MFFYDEFKKRIKSETVEAKGIHTFGKPLAKKILFILSGSIMVAVGVILEIEAAQKQQNIIQMAIPLLFIFMGISFISMINKYRIIVDADTKIIKHPKADINVDNIEKIVCKKMFTGKKFDVALDIITTDKVELVIPLVMERREHFVLLVKGMTAGKFSIE